MKTKLLILVLLPIFAISCTKDEEIATGESNSASNDLGEAKAEHQLRNIICEPSPIDIPTGCACFHPPENCLVEIIVRPSLVAFGNFNDAIDHNLQVDFFKTTDYKKIMPGLDDYPSFLTELQNGNKVFVEVGAKNSNERIYALVDKSVQSKFDESDIVLSVSFEV